MKKRIISLLLALIMVLGMIPMAMAEETAAEQTPALEPIVMDFMPFAADAAEQSFWDDLRNCNVAGAKVLGVPYGGAVEDSFRTAMTELENWMAQTYNWDIPNLTGGDFGHYCHPYAGRGIFIDPNQSNFGLRFYTNYPNNGGAECKLFLTVEVPTGAAGEYIMDVEGFYEALATVVAIYGGVDQGGGKANVYLNGELVGGFHQSKGDLGPDEIVVDGIGTVELIEGTNDITIEVVGDRNGGPYNGRCAINLRKITFSPIDHSDLVVDFMDIKDAATESFWADLRATDIDTVKAIGCTPGVSPEASYTAALNSLGEWLDANANWNIPDLTTDASTGGHYNHPYAQRRIYVDSANDYYGLRLHTSYPGNGYGECKFNLTVDVPAGMAGNRTLTIETYNEAETSVVPATEGLKGGAVASVSVNGVEVVDFGEFFAAEDGIGTIETDAVELVAGENNILITIQSDRNGVIQNAGSARCALNLRSITFSHVDCTHEDTATYEDYASLRDRTHETITYCECGAELGRETVQCADGEDDDTQCDGCGFELKLRGPSTSEFAETSIVIDFMDFAYQAMQQPWFNDLYMATKADGVRSIGLIYGDAASRTAEYEQAVYDAQTWLDENCNWTIEDLTEGNPYYLHEYGGRHIFIDSINEYYGIRFYTHRTADSSSDIAMLKLLVDVPADQVGTYEMNVEAFYEAVRSIVPMCESFDNGGGKAIILVNGEEVGTIHQTNGDPGADEVVIDTVGNVQLVEGLNSVVFNVVAERTGVPVSGRCALNLRNIEFKLVELSEEATCEHAETEITYTDNGDKTHTTKEICTACGKVMSSAVENCADNDDDDLCDNCGADLSCKHPGTSASITPNGDGSHTIAAVCGTCGETIFSEVGECSDGDGDDLCDTCGGSLVVITKFSMAGSNMTLGNELVVNVMFMKNKITGEGNTIEITHGDAVTTIAQENWESYNAAMYVARIPVAAKEMADDLTVTVKNADGYEIANAYTTSVREYAGKVLAGNINTYSQLMKNLAVDMLNYGAAAQTNFSYNTEDMANNALTEEQAGWATADVTCTNNQVKGAKCMGSNLSLESKILLNIIFQLTETAAADKYAMVTYTDYTGKAVEYRVDAFNRFNASMQGVVIDEIVLADAFQLVTVTVYNADGSVYGTGSDSVESYAARTTNDLNAAIMKFASSAKTYLSK